MRSIVILLIVLLPTVAAAQSPQGAPPVDPDGYRNLWVTADVPVYDTPSSRPAFFPFIKTPGEQAFELSQGEQLMLVGYRTEDSIPWFHVATEDGRDGWITGNESIRSGPLAATKALEDYYRFLSGSLAGEPDLLDKVSAVLESLKALEDALVARQTEP